MDPNQSGPTSVEQRNWESPIPRKERPRPAGSLGSDAAVGGRGGDAYET